jgi:hypothetical protein
MPRNWWEWPNSLVLAVVANRRSDPLLSRQNVTGQLLVRHVRLELTFVPHGIVFPGNVVSTMELHATSRGSILRTGRALRRRLEGLICGI